jgi:hypothetical protein
MATKLKVTRTNGDVSEYEITPAIEVAFEDRVKMGFFKAMRESEKQSDVYWIAWEAIRRSGEAVKPFGDEFLNTLSKVEVVDSDPLA